MHGERQVVCVHGEREVVSIWKGGVCMHEERRVCIRKWSSVHAW